MADTQPDIARRGGLPCRGGCSWLITMTERGRSDPTAFALLCKARVDHERAAHGYVHAPVGISKARYDWGAPKRHVLPGQGI